MDVDGIPCSIVSFSQSVITCKTGTPPDGSPVLANAGLSYPSVQSGFRFKGIGVFVFTLQGLVQGLVQGVVQGLVQGLVLMSMFLDSESKFM